MWQDIHCQRDDSPSQELISGTYFVLTIPTCLGISAVVGTPYPDLFTFHSHVWVWVLPSSHVVPSINVCSPFIVIHSLLYHKLPLFHHRLSYSILIYVPSYICMYTPHFHSSTPPHLYTCVHAPHFHTSTPQHLHTCTHACACSTLPHLHTSTPPLLNTSTPVHMCVHAPHFHTSTPVHMCVHASHLHISTPVYMCVYVHMYIRT